MRAPADDAIMAPFFARVDEIEALADDSPGFIWRLPTPLRDTELMRVFGSTRISVNMTVWESIDQLFDFTYRGTHLEPFRRRRDWFEKPDAPVYALWWVRAGDHPSTDEGHSRLQLLRRLGPSPDAFTFRQRFAPPNG
jgi:hypothetical protein